jgi:UDP-glucose 4-epimerase
VGTLGGEGLAHGLAPARDPASLVASSSLIAEELSWKPERQELSEIIGDAWRWHESHPEGYNTP